MKVLISVILTLVAVFVILLIFIYCGLYNVSAMNEDRGLMSWIFNTTKKKSIEQRIKDISVPDLNDSLMIKEGFEHYDEMCSSCHGKPGMEETELSKGLNPRAPYLPKVAKYIDPAKLFWATKNGIKMTGMPAWGKTHSDDKIWAIVAFVKKLPSITKNDYDKMKSGL
jgi:mono/diheme cytochrome c family protein